MKYRHILNLSIILVMVLALFVTAGGAGATSYVVPFRVPNIVAAAHWSGTNPSGSGDLYGEWAPFTVQVDVSVDNTANAVLYTWFAGPGGNPVYQTWNRFSAAPPHGWVDQVTTQDQPPTGLSGIALNANTDTRIMVVGRMDTNSNITGLSDGDPLTVNLYWCLDRTPGGGDGNCGGGYPDESGVITFTPSFYTNVDWFYNGSAPVPGREVSYWRYMSSADAQATAPVDSNGYFALPVALGCSSQFSYRVTAVTELDANPYSWTFTPTVNDCGSTGGDNAMYDIGSGGPTAITLLSMTAVPSRQAHISLALLLSLLALAGGYRFAMARKTM